MKMCILYNMVYTHEFQKFNHSNFRDCHFDDLVESWFLFYFYSKQLQKKRLTNN